MDKENIVKLIFTPWGFIVVGAMVIAGGLALAWNGRHEKIPERTELTQVSGTVQHVTKRVTEKDGSQSEVKFEIEVDTARGRTVKLVLPDSQIGERQAAALTGRQVAALIRYNDPSNVWEFSTGIVKIIDYAETRRALEESLRSDAENGPYVAGTGAFISILGAVWLYRRHNNKSAGKTAKRQRTARRA